MGHAVVSGAPLSRRALAVSSGLSRRHRRLEHDHGNSAAYYLLYFREKRNPERSRRALGAGGAAWARAARPGPHTVLAVTAHH
jgi:hypothetical protein